MKKAYVKPSIESVELRPEEIMATGWCIKIWRGRFRKTVKGCRLTFKQKS